MLRTVEAILDPSGQVRLLEPVPVAMPTRALVTVLAPDADAGDTARLAEAALATDWLRDEEEAAWAHLQSDK